MQPFDLHIRVRASDAIKPRSHLALTKRGRDNGHMDEKLIASLRAQLAGPRDGALLRYSLGNALLNAGDASQAVVQLREALTFDSNYSAAWKLLGKAQLALDEKSAAAEAWREGIAVAQKRGDVQAAKEMTVFLKRLDK